MKKIVVAAAFVCGLFASAQDAETKSKPTVEKSIFNVQPGLLGLYVNNEYRIADKIALRSEVGVDAAFSINTYDSKWGLLPMVNLEPRFYYNIAKRARKGRNTSGNAANFLALTARLNPGEVVYSSESNLRAATSLFIAPKWGVRRNIGQSNFNYEAGIGIGYYTLLGSDKKYYNEKEGVGLDLHLRLGYTFN